MYYLTHSWEDKGVHTFPKGIYPKANVIARLEYELVYYDSAVHRFNHYLDLARELKKTMEHEGDDYTNSDSCFWHSN